MAGGGGLPGGVPLLDLKAQFAPLREEILSAIERVVDSQHFILGPEVQGLEAEVADFCQVKHGIGVSSGTDALLVALMSIDIGPGDEVICPAFTFFATAGAISRLGATPVFVDIDPATYNICASSARNAVTARTRAIIPVHLFGQMAEMAEICAIAQDRELVIIEDAAQAIGAKYQDRSAGSIGEMGCLSFFPSKNLGAFGDGGMVLTSRGDLAARLRLLRNHGYYPKYYNQEVGGNFRLDALQAAILRVKLPHLDRWTERRRQNAERYRELLSDLPIGLPQEHPGCFHIYNQFVIRSERRSQIIELLRDRKIGSEIYYPHPLHLQECFKNLGYRNGDLPMSERAAEEVLALPIYPELTEEQLRFVAQSVKDAVC